MRRGFFLAATAMLAVALPSIALAADPAVVYQTQPVGRVLDDVRATVKLVAGDKAVEDVNKDIKRKLGDKGFLGLDINRPVLGYVDVAPNLTDTVLVLALPVSNEKEFLDFCERWNKSKPKSLKDGLYEVPPLTPELKAVMRISDGYAYIATSMSDPARALDAKSIVPTAKLYDPTDISLASGRVYFDRLPKEVWAKAKQGLDFVKLMMAGGGAQLGAPEKLILEPVLGLGERFLHLSEGAKQATLRLDLNAGTADFQATLTVTPNAGSPLEKVIGGMKPASNAFAGLVTPDAAAGGRIHVPFDVPEVRDGTVKALEFLQKEAANNAFPPMQPFISELLKGAIRTVKAGPVDVGVALRGPDRDGFFTGVGAITFDDPSAVEKEFKKFTTTAPQELQKCFQWDAEKINGVSIHLFDFGAVPGREGGDEIRAMFGPNAKMAFAFAPKAYYQAIGPDVIATLKAAMTVKPEVVPDLEVAINPSRLVKFIQAIEPQAGGMAAKVLGTDDKLAQALVLSVSGGKELTVRLGLNGLLLGRWSVALEVGAANAPPPPVFK
jgi:hypothetical protein